MGRNYITETDKTLIERFLTAYNKIDHFLRGRIIVDREQGFKKVVHEYGQKYPSWPHKDALLLLADLRNVLTHNRVEVYEYLSVPTEPVVWKIEQIRDSLIEPQKVIPAFQRNVLTVSLEDSLLHVLKLVRENNYSQFPVYKDGEFQGLITENGIAFWLASHVKEMSLVEFEEQTVKDVLFFEEQRKNYLFIGRTTPVYEANGLFMKERFLEAVLITKNGKKTEKLLGIMTRWDLSS